MFFLFLTILLLLEVLEINPFTCNTSTNFTMANDFDCNRYYICSNGSFTEYTCPTETPYFNADSSNCTSEYDCSQLIRTNCDISFTVPLNFFDSDTCIKAPFHACNHNSQWTCTSPCTFKNYTVGNGTLQACVTTDTLPPVWSSCNCILTT